MSSKNVYLNEEERKAAGVIYRSLIQTSEMIKSGIINKEKIKGFMKEKLSTEPLVREIQYASCMTLERWMKLKMPGKRRFPCGLG